MTTSSFIEAGSHKIFIRETGNKQKPSIIFIHGASLSSEFWYKQFADKNLTDNFCLYAFDLPGHGQSEKANNRENYSLKALGETVNNIIKLLPVERYILVALSISTNIVAETVEKLKGCEGIFMTGACIIGEKFPVSSLVMEFPYMYLLSASSATMQELEDYAHYDMFRPSKDDLQKFIAAYQNTDPGFRNTLGKVLAENDYADEVENIKKAALPLALIYGREEAIVKPLYLKEAGFKLWENKIHLIENAGHLANMDNPAAFNQLC